VNSDRIKRHVEKKKKERIDPGLPDLHPLRNPSCRKRVEDLYEEAKNYAGSIVIFYPTGALKAAIAEEKTKCIEAACDAINKEDKEYALKLNYVIPFLLLQRPSKKMKNEKTRSNLLRDITLWRKGELNDIASRAILCAKHARDSKRRSPHEKILPPLETEFAEMVQRAVGQGRIGRAGAMVSEGKDRKGPAPLSDEVKAKLANLHPKARRSGEAIPECSLPPKDAYGFIDGEHIFGLLLQLKGAGGPSGNTPELVRCLGRQKNPEGMRLCEAYAKLARMTMEELLPEGCLAPITINRLIALQKEGGGIRPVGIGEAERRLLGMAVARATKGDVQKVCGALQTCAGLAGGCEAAALAMQQMWDDPDVEALLLVDARNAFNKASREKALITSSKRCPTLAVPLRNFYGHVSELLLEDGSRLLSEEGTTQGCPLGMAMFCVASIPLIEKGATQGMAQVWCADDSGGAGKVGALREWYDKLLMNGGEYGYEVNPCKTVAVVKDKHLDSFLKSFDGLTDTEKGGIMVVSGGGAGAIVGRRYLGVGVGSSAFRKEFVKKKVEELVSQIHLAAEVAEMFPREAYALLIRSLIPRWRFVMRTTDVPSALYQPLEDALLDVFFPKTFGWTPRGKRDLRARCALAVRNAGLAIPNPCRLAEEERRNCRMANGELVAAIRRQDWGFREDKKTLDDIREARRKESDEREKAEALELLEQLQGRERKGMEEILEGGCSAWLGAVPLECLGLTMERITFRDAVALRMGLPPPDHLPSHCPSCGEGGFDVTHALKCKKGAWVRRRHDEVKKAWATLFKKVSTTVVEEPFLPLPTGLRTTKKTTSLDLDARADIFVRGISRPLSNDYFDVAVIDTGTNSHVGKKSMTALRDKEQRKRAKYDERIQAVGSFTPLVCSIYGTLAPEAAKTLQLIVKGLDEEQPEKRNMIALQRVYLQTAIIKATSMCLRNRSTDIPPDAVAYPDSLDDCRAAVAEAFPRP
jgi:hypothetical protein